MNVDCTAAVNNSMCLTNQCVCLPGYQVGPEQTNCTMRKYHFPLPGTKTVRGAVEFELSVTQQSANTYIRNEKDVYLNAVPKPLVTTNINVEAC